MLPMPRKNWQVNLIVPIILLCGVIYSVMTLTDPIESTLRGYVVGVLFGIVLSGFIIFVNELIRSKKKS